MTSIFSLSKSRWVIASLMAVIALSACSSKTVKLSEPTPLTDIENQITITKQWSRDIGGFKKRLFYKPQIAHSDNSIYASNKNIVTSLNATTGQVQWKTRIKGSNLTGATGTSPNQVLVGDDEGYVFALDKSTGDVIWETKVLSEILTAPTGDSGIVIALGGDGQIYGFNATDGIQRWTIDTIKPVLLNSGNSSPIIVDGIVYIAQDNGKVLAVNATDGVRKWDARIAIPQGDNELDRLVDIDGAPLYHSGSLYAASLQGGIMGLDIKTGRPEWAKKISTTNPLAASGGTLVATEVDAVIKAFSITDGTILWENDSLKFRKLGSSIVTPDYVATMDYKGFLHVLNRRDGKIIARKKIASKGEVSPMIYRNDRLYVLDKSGKLQSYTLGQ